MIRRQKKVVFCPFLCIEVEAHFVLSTKVEEPENRKHRTTVTSWFADFMTSSLPHLTAQISELGSKQFFFSFPEVSKEAVAL